MQHSATTTLMPCDTHLAIQLLTRAEHGMHRGSKHDFVATVSHELRTPLASIYGATVTLQRTDLELDATVRAQLLRIIGEQSQQMADLIDTVLLASGLEAGCAALRSETIDPSECVREVVDAARGRVRNDGAHIDFRLDLPRDDVRRAALVNADPAALRQVLGNLVENAIKYSPLGGTVRIAVDQVDDVVQMTVKDEGIGIDAPDLPRIFEKFSRASSFGEHHIGGTGLGLFIVRELARRMGGEVSVQSQAGSGSTFVVKLPALDAVGCRYDAANRPGPV